MHDTTSSLLEESWQLHRRWSAVAESMHRTVERRRTLNLWLLIVGSAVGAAGGVADRYDWQIAARVFGVAAGAALSGAALVQQRVLGSRAIDRWIVARSCSERLKAAVYLTIGRRAVGVPDDSTAVSAAIDETAETGADFALDLHDAVTDERPLPRLASFEEYVNGRAVDQAAWHRSAIVRLRRRSTRYRRLEFGATIAGGALSLAAALVSGAAVVIGVGALTTIASACAAHLSASRYGRIATSYAVTCAALARQIDGITRDGLAGGVTGARQQAFVEAVEAILGEQNRTWLLLNGAD